MWVCGSKNSSAWTTLSACGAVEVRVGERAEVIAIAQHVAAGVVEVEERLQVAEAVRGAHLLDRAVRERDAVLAARANIISGSSVPSMWR